jgi:hypothetical protein
MKDFVKKVKSFATFDFPLQMATIASQFANTHLKLQIDIPEWSTNSTRQKLIYSYWFNHVTGHFAMLLGLPALIALMLCDYSGGVCYCLLNILISGLVSYPVMYLFHYRPCFDCIFLPRLETIKETYENKQRDQLEKCRQLQLSNFALTLIFYVFNKTCKMDSLQCNDTSAKLMATLYGVDAGSLKKNLALIIGKSKELSPRRSAELRNQFEEAFVFFDEIGFAKGSEILHHLESKLLSCSEK